MLKAKLCSIAIAGIIGLAGISPLHIYAADAGNESVTLSETKSNHREKKAAFEKKLKEANEKWNALTDEQKADVYALLEEEIQVRNRLIDKLVELEIMDSNDAKNFKAHMSEGYDKVKESGEFPIVRPKEK